MEKKINILLLGSGGREHALAWKMRQSARCNSLFVAPGNAGTAQEGINLDININDFPSVAKACIEHQIGLMVVGPEEPLVMGIRDYFEADPTLKNIKIVGPGKAGAQLEGSKAFSKIFMTKYNIATAAYAEFELQTYQQGIAYLQEHTLPIVLKADGLAAGKGVVICESHAAALAEFEEMIKDSKFGDAGKKVVVEEFLTGIEMSLFVLTDGENFVLLPEAKDYKKIGEGDKGPNTGGMGAVSPVPFFDEKLRNHVVETIVNPTIAGLKLEDIAYKGIIFIGLIVENNKANVIEYNCRFGDPETEVIIPRLQNDLVDLFLATSEGKLGEVSVEIANFYTACVVAVSAGYPGSYEKGKIITIPEEFLNTDTHLFHAGTTRKNDEVVTIGGRVLVSVAEGKDIKEAAEKALAKYEKTNFNGISFRKDIGYEFYV